MRRIVILSILMTGCATAPGKRPSEMAQKIERSSVRIVSKKNAEDGSRASGVVAFLMDNESPTAEAAAEQFCDGPVIVKSEDYLATGDVTSDGGVAVWGDVAFASSSSKLKKAWRMVFDCNRNASAESVAKYREKFAKTVTPGIGDFILGAR